MVPRNAPVPRVKVESFTTAYDNQESMLFRIFEGERTMAKNNLLLGEIELTGIPRAPRHVPRVSLNFVIHVCVHPARIYMTRDAIC